MPAHETDSATVALSVGATATPLTIQDIFNTTKLIMQEAAKTSSPIMFKEAMQLAINFTAAVK